MPTISTKLQDKTYKIIDQFFKNTDHLTVNDDLGREILLRRTDEFFSVLKGLGKEEFAKIFFGYNFTSSDIKENEKHQEILNYLLVAVIEKYSQTDLLRYFFSKNISQKENRPEYSNSSSIVSYCLQLISYWLRQIRNKPNYELKTEHAGIADSIQYVKISSNKDYVDNDLNDVFKQHLAILREQAFPLQNVISRVNSSNDQAYHQQLLDKEKE